MILSKLLHEKVSCIAVRCSWELQETDLQVVKMKFKPSLVQDNSKPLYRFKTDS